MKMTSILTTAAASASLLMASTAFSATVMEMTGVTAAQVLKVSGCKTSSSSVTVDVVFDDAGTYSINSSGNPVLQGTWFKLASKTPTTYTVYMTPSVYAPAPDDAGNNADPTPAPIPPGTLDDFLDNLEASVSGMQCTIKSGGSQTATLIQPSTLIKKNTLVVKNGVGKLNVSISGAQMNNFKPVAPPKLPKSGKFSATLTIQGSIAEI